MKKQKPALQNNRFQPVGANAVYFHSGRIVLVSLFILGGIDKLLNPGASLASMTAAGFPAPSVLIYFVILVELGLGLVIAFAGAFLKGSLIAVAAMILVLHTAAINLLLHNFWTMEGEIARLELSLFFKNVAICGGLVMLAGLYRSGYGK